jgi:hypothetical protein
MTEIVIEAGARGLPGPQGPQGPQGPPGTFPWGVQPALTLVDPALAQFFFLRAPIPAPTSDVIYEVPAGKSLVFGRFFCANPTDIAMTVDRRVQIGPYNLRINSPLTSVVNKSYNNMITGAPIVLNPGDRILAGAGVAGMMGYVEGLLFDHPSPVKMDYIVNVSTTPQILVQAATTIYPVITSDHRFVHYTSTAYVVNDSGVTHIVDFHFVPYGGTMGSDTFCARATVTSGGFATFLSAPPYRLQPGDAIYAVSNSDVPGCWIRMAYLTT